MIPEPLIVCTFEDLDIPHLQSLWQGYHEISPWILDRKVEFPSITDGRVRLTVVDFQRQILTEDVFAFAMDQRMAPISHEWLWAVNCLAVFGAQPVVALATILTDHKVALYTTRFAQKLQLSVSWGGRPGWSIGCLFPFVAPI